MIIPTILKIFNTDNTKDFNVFIINLYLYMHMCDMYVWACEQNNFMNWLSPSTFQGLNSGCQGSVAPLHAEPSHQPSLFTTYFYSKHWQA